MKRPLPPFVFRPAKKPAAAKPAHLDDKAEIKPKRRPMQTLDRLSAPSLRVLGRVHDQLIRVRV